MIQLLCDHLSPPVPVPSLCPDQQVMILLAMLIFLRCIIYYALQRATSFKKQQ